MKGFGSLVLLLVALSACADNDMHLADGSEGQFAQYQGNWLLINYWAEWCGPCRKEIPELNELHHQREQNGIAILGVNFDGITGADLTQLIASMEIEFPVLLDDPRLRWQQETPAVLPTTFLINPQGELAAVLVGPQTLDSLNAAVAQHSQP